MPRIVGVCSLDWTTWRTTLETQHLTVGGSGEPGRKHKTHFFQPLRPVQGNAEMAGLIECARHLGNLL